MMRLSDKIPTLGFIGAGNMAGTIIHAVVGQGLIEPTDCAAYDVLEEKTQNLAAMLNIQAPKEPGGVLDAC